MPHRVAQGSGGGDGGSKHTGKAKRRCLAVMHRLLGGMQEDQRLRTTVARCCGERRLAGLAELGGFLRLDGPQWFVRSALTEGTAVGKAVLLGGGGGGDVKEDEEERRKAAGRAAIGLLLEVAGLRWEGTGAWARLVPAVVVNEEAEAKAEEAEEASSSDDSDDDDDGDEKELPAAAGAAAASTDQKKKKAKAKGPVKSTAFDAVEGLAPSLRRWLLRQLRCVLVVLVVGLIDCVFD